MHKVGRNDPCPCGSGKKYKKCCEFKPTHKKFHAEVITSEKVTPSFFKRIVAPGTPPATSHDENPTNPM